MSVKMESKKSASIREHIRRQIEIGNFSRGALLPSERELADQLGASYMTIRKAIGQLVDERYLERIPRIGTYVCSEIRTDKVLHQLGIIVPAWSSPENSDLQMYLSEAAEQGGWLPKFFFARSWEDRTILDAWQSCDGLVCMAPQPLNKMPDALLERFKSHEKPVVFIGIPAHHFGLDAVGGSMEMELGVILDRLSQTGHRRIALIDQHTLMTENPSYYSVWKQRIADTLGDKAVSELNILVETPRFELPHRAIYNRLMSIKRKVPFTAVIVRASFVWGVVAALTDLKLDIPGDVSIVCNGDRQEMPFYRPKLTYLNVSLRDHAHKALELIRRRMENPGMQVQYAMISPQFIEGETLKNLG